MPDYLGGISKRLNKMKKQQKIEAGKWWQVYPADNPDCILHEGSRTECMRFIRANCLTAWRKGDVRIGKLIYENLKLKQ